MKRITISLILILFSTLFASSNNSILTSVSCYSPDGKLRIDVFSDSAELFYKVFKNNSLVIDTSRLGLCINGSNTFSEGLQIVSENHKEYNEKWETVWGESRFVYNRNNEKIINLINANNQKLILYIKAFNETVAFRYFVPKQEGLNEIWINDEITEFNFTDNHKTWSIPQDYDSYEHLYRTLALNEVDNANTPITFKTKEGLYLSIHEAALSNYAGMTLVKDSNSQYKFSCDLVPWPDGVKVKTTAPMKSPWRVIMICKNLKQLTENKNILNLNDPNKIEDVSWIKPIKYSGIWWTMHMGAHTWEEGKMHGANTSLTKEYIDFSSENNIDAVLIEGWNKGWDTWRADTCKFDFINTADDFNIEELVAYAHEKGVEIIGHHETGGNIVAYEKQLEEALKMYSELGIKYLKTGYAGEIVPKGQYHHGQFMVNHYRRVIELAAKYKIMLNAHEPITATGISRTYPNMMTREGARGMEWNAWSTGNSPEHTCILPFTRSLAGPLDYNPGIFNILFNSSPESNRVHTTLAKQLALYVILYSPWQMLADLPENYNEQAAFNFIKNVPVNFDQTIFIDGEIGDYITIARKKADKWYLGSITDENERFSKISLDFLDKNKQYIAYIYSDCSQTNWYKTPSEYKIGTYEVSSDDTLYSALSKTGGMAVEFIPKEKESAIFENPENFNKESLRLFEIFKNIPDKSEYSIVHHLAVGKAIDIINEPNNKFASFEALIDGKKGNPLIFKENWCGFKDNNLEAIIDLEKTQNIQKIEVRFLEDQMSWIFLPEEVKILTSIDGINYDSLHYENQKSTKKQDQKRIYTCASSANNLTCRYIKIVASPLQVLPEWHNGKGGSAWMFIDEIVVRDGE
ncbi:MAG: glycoside hydrolase family 97 protein [Bacteroidales bacterium]|nr:glycoside hydrolase family 97 protein [Bacteroidales bacterium]